MIRIWFFDGLGHWSWLATIPPLLFPLYYWYKDPEEFKKCFCPIGQHLPLDYKWGYLLCFVSFGLFLRAILYVSELNDPKISWFSGKLLYQIISSFSTWLYPIWALGQQLILNGYFADKIDLALQGRYSQNHSYLETALFTGLLFSLIHLPNPVLMPVTLIGGILSVYFFYRTQNIYLIAILHAALALSVKYSLPDSWHHNLRIGPGF